MLKGNLLLSACALLLTGCTFTPFQPPPPEFTKWQKNGASVEDVKSGMRACGYTNLAGTGDKTPIDQALKRFYCMKDSGFTRKDNLDLCKQGRIGESPICEDRR
nr:hypothetical protein [Pseudomonas batumici]